MDKGRITAKFFIDKDGKFKTNLKIHKMPDDLIKFIGLSAVSISKVYKVLEDMYGRDHRTDGVPGVRCTGSKSES